MSFKRPFRIIVHVGPSTREDCVALCRAMSKLGEIFTEETGASTTGELQLDGPDAAPASAGPSSVAPPSSCIRGMN